MIILRVNQLVSDLLAGSEIRENRDQAICLGTWNAYEGHRFYEELAVYDKFREQLETVRLKYPLAVFFGRYFGDFPYYLFLCMRHSREDILYMIRARHELAERQRQFQQSLTGNPSSDLPRRPAGSHVVLVAESLEHAESILAMGINAELEAEGYDVDVVIRWPGETKTQYQLFTAQSSDDNGNEGDTKETEFPRLASGLEDSESFSDELKREKSA